MSFFSRAKKIIKPFVDIPKWIGYRQLVKTNRFVFAFAKKFFIPEQASYEESFETALLRLKLTEADLVQRRKEFIHLLWVWTLLFFASIGYSSYLFVQHSLRGFFPCLAVTFIILTQVFRYHFWIFQIKQRRLGCRFRDWLNTYFTFGK